MDCPTPGSLPKVQIGVIVGGALLHPVGSKNSGLCVPGVPRFLFSSWNGSDKKKRQCAYLTRPCSYLRNLDTNGDVSPRRMKCPDGPSPRNSENQDSCSISSLSIASARS